MRKPDAASLIPRINFRHPTRPGQISPDGSGSVARPKTAGSTSGLPPRDLQAARVVTDDKKRVIPFTAGRSTAARLTCRTRAAPKSGTSMRSRYGWKGARSHAAAGRVRLPPAELDQPASPPIAIHAAQGLHDPMRRYRTGERELILENLLSSPSCPHRQCGRASPPRLARRGRQQVFRIEGLHRNDRFVEHEYDMRPVRGFTATPRRSISSPRSAATRQRWSPETGRPAQRRCWRSIPRPTSRRSSPIRGPAWPKPPPPSIASRIGYR